MRRIEIMGKRREQEEEVEKEVEQEVEEKSRMRK